MVYSQIWEQHIEQLRHLLEKLSQAKLTVNLAKSEFCQANVIYLGHVVGQGKVKPIKAKFEAIEKFPSSHALNKEELQRFFFRYGWILQNVLSQLFRYCLSFDKFAVKNAKKKKKKKKKKDRSDRKWFQ